MKINNCEQEIIKFASWLTNQNEDDIKQLFDDYNDYKDKNLPEIKGGRVEAEVMPNEVIGGGHLTDKEFETLSVRITPAFYDIDLDGATNCKGDVLRKLRIIFNDIIDSRREA